MSRNRISTRKIIEKIQKITKEKMASSQVVDLGEFRTLKQREEPKTMLIIDDDESMRASLRRTFEPEGFRVLVAADGSQLSMVLDDSPVDFIILDVGLPWINGYELAKLLKESDDLKQIPLIFISGKTSELDIKRGFEVGADDYITKPFEIDQIKKAVFTLLKLKSTPKK